jgi:hypothetical protein
MSQSSYRIQYGRRKQKIRPYFRKPSLLTCTQIGDRVGIPVWVLSPSGEFPRDFFRDGFHLNGHGSEIFTAPG